jgi:hypothetical protein
MLDDLCEKILTKYTLEQLKKEAINIAYEHDYATALAWTVVNKNTNNDLGKVGEHLANHFFNWKRVKGDTDSIIGNHKVEIKTSAPPMGSYRIGQIKLNYDLTQSLFCQFFHFKTKQLQFYWIPTIQTFLDEFEQWVGNDQGNDGSNVGIRSIPHEGPCWTKLQQWRIAYDDIPRGLETTS